MYHTNIYMSLGPQLCQHSAHWTMSKKNAYNNINAGIVMNPQGSMNFVEQIYNKNPLQKLSSLQQLTVIDRAAQSNVDAITNLCPVFWVYSHPSSMLNVFMSAFQLDMNNCSYQDCL
jgi:hypothetical protein